MLMIKDDIYLVVCIKYTLWFTLYTEQFTWVQ